MRFTKADQSEFAEMMKLTNRWATINQGKGFVDLYVAISQGELLDCAEKLEDIIQSVPRNNNVIIFRMWK